jgi:hypothetical protein
MNTLVPPLDNGAAPPPPSPTQELAAEVIPRIQEAQQKILLLNERALAFIQERPGTCLLGAVALGFVVGKIASRY